MPLKASTLKVGDLTFSVIMVGKAEG